MDDETHYELQSTQKSTKLTWNNSSRKKAKDELISKLSTCTSLQPTEQAEAEILLK